MAVRHVRGKRAPDTAYTTFKTVHSQRSATRDGDPNTDVDLGSSPITRWLSYAFTFEDGASNTDGRYTYSFLVPRGSIIMDAMVRLDEEWDGTGSDVNIGDSSQASGYADALDLTSAITTTPILKRDASAVYVDKDAADIVAGTTSFQIYINGGTVLAVAQGSPINMTQGKAILFLKTLSYHEPLDSEWT